MVKSNTLDVMAQGSMSYVGMEKTTKILLSCEVPTKFLPHFDNYLDYHFCLSHLVLQDPKYRAFYKQSRKYKILDNSAFELSAPMSNAKIVEAAKLISPDEIVCRDSMGDGIGTIKRTIESIDYFHRQYWGSNYMAVCHGSNFADWERCLKWLYGNNQIHVIGLCGWPSAINAFKYRIKTDDPGECRLAALRFIQKEGYTGKMVHLLGMGNNPIELLEASKYNFVRSCDTSSPVVHGMYNIKFDKRVGLFGPKIKEKLNFNLDRLHPVQQLAIEFNLKQLHSWSKGEILK